MATPPSSYWATVLFCQSEPHGPATQQDWDADLPSEKSPVLADSELKLHDWIGGTAYPVFNLINSDLNLTIHRSSGPYLVLTEVSNLP